MACAPTKPANPKTITNWNPKNIPTAQEYWLICRGSGYWDTKKKLYIPYHYDSKKDLKVLGMLFTGMLVVYLIYILACL